MNIRFGWILFGFVENVFCLDIYLVNLVVIYVFWIDICMRWSLI